MKLIKTLMAGALALAFAATAHATTIHIYLVGSTAYRSSVHTAIINQLNAGGAYTFAYSSSSGASGIGAAPGNAAAGSGASQQIYSGTIAGQAVIIKTNWSGSAGGCQAVSQGISTKFMTDGSLTGATSSGLVVAGTVTDAEIPTVTMSDVFQSSTPFVTPALTAAGGNGTSFVGVVPFVFVINKDWASANPTFNVTPQLARDLWANGYEALALYTGSNADELTYVYAAGRDNDSGTRLTAFAETGVGVFSTVTQYQPQFGGSVTALTAGTGASAGTGYTSAPTVTIYGSGGFGYTSTPTVTFTGGGGSVAPLGITTTVTNGSVTSIVVASGSSSGYTSAPTVVITGGTAATAVGAAATTVVDTAAGSSTQGQVTQVVIANPGSGATATATIASGTLSGFTSLVGGSGFQSAPTVLLTGGGGSGATASATTGNYVSTGLLPWPAETVNGIGLIEGNGGYSSGGSLAVALGTTGELSNSDGYLLSYLGTSDAATATGLQVAGTFSGTGLGAKVCTYNGVTYSQNAIQEGQYTFWGYEHMYYSSALTSVTNGVTVMQAVATQIASTDAIIKVGTGGNMNVVRATDGGVVSPNY